MPSHDHDHGHDHGHAHPRSHGEPEPASALPQDAASENLARALRLAFMALSAIMALVLVLFAFSGMTTIQAGQKGIVTIFGRKVAVVEPGLHYTWPFPVGQIEPVDVRKQVLTIDRFWMGETPQDRLKIDLSTRTPSSGGLRPGWDGALLTGDAYLVHLKLECDYEVEDVFAFRSGLEDPRDGIEAAVCRAAIQAAARRTAEGLVLDDEDQRLFAQDVQISANDALHRMQAGVRVSQIRLGGQAGGKPTWPLRVLSDARAAQMAAQQERDARQRAVQEATALLSDAVGPEFRRLVGEPWEEPRGALSPGADPNDYDLIGQYERVRGEANGSPRRAEEILARIDERLLSLSAQGQVTAILSAASTYRDARRGAVIARAGTLQKLLANYDQSPDFFLQRFWMEAKQEMLQSPGVVKWFITPGEGKTLLQINTPPEILKSIQQWYLRSFAPGSSTPGPINQ
jgi:modulator of FtsH protease HflK